MLHTFYVVFLAFHPPHAAPSGSDKPNVENRGFSMKDGFERISHSSFSAARKAGPINLLVSAGTSCVWTYSWQTLYQISWVYFLNKIDFSFKRRIFPRLKESIQVQENTRFLIRNNASFNYIFYLDFKNMCRLMYKPINIEWMFNGRLCVLFTGLADCHAKVISIAISA